MIEDDYSFDEFKSLGFSRQVGVSAEHGIGIDQLTDLFKNFFLHPNFLLVILMTCD